MNYKQQIIEAGIQMASQDLTIETWGNLTRPDKWSHLSNTKRHAI